MRIVSVYNYYKNRGGEDEVVDSETLLLERYGHTVIRYSKHNDDLSEMNRFRLAAATLWNRAAYAEVRELLRSAKPDIIHFHNTFPIISPAAYYAARREGVPVVQTLHNFRLLCPNSLLFRNGGVCEDCLGSIFAWPGVLHACYQDSRINTAGVASMTAFHRLLSTWQKKVDVYIALTEFARQKFVCGGLPAGKIVVKPNFVDPDPGVHLREREDAFALFVGRLSDNKGVKVVLRAWELLGGRIPLHIVGDGPLMSEAAAVANKTNIVLRGRLSREQTIALMRRAYVLVVPSVSYEGMPTTIIEAFAAGLPVVASHLGSMAVLVDDHRTGVHFAPGDSQDLMEKVTWCLDHPDAIDRMGVAARAEFEARYTADRNYPMLMSIYAKAQASAVGSTTAVCAERQ